MLTQMPWMALCSMTKVRKNRKRQENTLYKQHAAINQGKSMHAQSEVHQEALQHRTGTVSEGATNIQLLIRRLPVQQVRPATH
jgi:hypothetical protein